MKIPMLRKVHLHSLGGLVIAGCLFALPAVVTAEEASPVEKGRERAERLCARCLTIGRTGESPFAEAPPLRMMVRKWPLESLEEAFAEGIVVGHPAMPVFTFVPGDIRNLLTYMDSVSR